MFINLGKIKNQIKVEKISVEISKLKKPDNLEIKNVIRKFQYT